MSFCPLYSRGIAVSTDSPISSLCLLSLHFPSLVDGFSSRCFLNPSSHLKLLPQSPHFSEYPIPFPVFWEPCPAARLRDCTLSGFPRQTFFKWYLYPFLVPTFHVLLISLHTGSRHWNFPSGPISGGNLPTRVSLPVFLSKPDLCPFLALEGCPMSSSSESESDSSSSSSDGPPDD